MQVLFKPNGGVLALGREKTTVPPEYLRMLAVLGDTSADLDLGLHCSRCKENLRGLNGRSDGTWTLECGCRTFTGGNPLPPNARGMQ